MSADEILPALALILSLTAATVVFALLLISIYCKLRRLFTVRVNCWFCNSWTKVPYDNKNSFDCPNCLQYNGFDETGDYNKEIPAQYDEMQNFRSPLTKTNLTEASNGLCYICNNNQQLKVFQLANFVPMNEEHYDIEIEHFRKQLEKAYKLCSKCDSRLKETITSQNKWLLGLKIKQLKQDSIKYFLKTPKHSLLQSFLNVIIVVFASLILINAIHKAGIFDPTVLDNLSLYYLSLKSNLTTFYAVILANINEYLSDGYTNLKVATVINCNFTEYNFSKSLVEIGDFWVNPVTVVGLSLQIVTSVFTRRNVLKYPPLVLWSLLVVVSAHDVTKNVAFSAVQIFGSILIIYTILSEKPRKPAKETDKHRPPLQNNVFDNISTQYNPINQQNASPKHFINDSYIYPSDNDSNDTAISDNSFQSVLSKSTMKSFNTCLNKPLNTSNPCNSEIFSGPPIFRTFLTPSPNVFKSDFHRTETTKRSFQRQNSGSENILNHSLDNLYIDKRNNNLYRMKSNESLNNYQFKPINQFKPIEKINMFNANVCRPLISPPRLKIFGDLGSTYFPNSNISRCSSQSSGFMSQSPVMSSRNSVCSDVDRESLYSYKPKSELNFSTGRNFDAPPCSKSLSLRSFNHFY